MQSAHAQYRIESNHTLMGRLLPGATGQRNAFNDRSLAVATAAKSMTLPSGQEIRVVHVPTGEVVFRTTSRGEASPDLE